MKKFLSVFLSAVMVMSLATTAFAADHETLVRYEGQGVSEYLLTVPAKLAPGESDDVKLEGTWPTNETIVVTADSTVTLVNDIDSSEKVLDIEFNGISQAGSNTETITVIEDISVSSMTNALFGTWSGEFYYNLTIENGGSATIPEYATAFADNSWEDIIIACQNNEVPATWNIGDTKPMTINGAEYNIQIIGKDHDTYSDGSGTAPLTFQLVELHAVKQGMNATGDSPTGWSASRMRLSNMPTILATMPSEVQSAIKAVNKETLKGNGTGLETTSDKLFLLSEYEVLGTTSRSKGYAEGSRYAYYANGGSAVKQFNGSNSQWWLRGPSGTEGNFSNISTGGKLQNGNGGGGANYGVSFGFCF